MSALETLRAFSRAALPGNEKNEINERTPSESEKTAPVPPDEALSSFNSFLSSPGNADDLDERAAIIEEGAGVPKRWAEGFAAMSSMPAPAGFSPERWQRIVDAAGVLSTNGLPRPSPAAGAISTCLAAIPLRPTRGSTAWVSCFCSIAVRSPALTRLARI